MRETCEESNIRTHTEFTLTYTYKTTYTNKNTGMILGSDGEKMSKSRGNVVNPDDVVKEYGGDALRLYEMFMGPLEAVKPWQTAQVAGVVRFRDKVFQLVANRQLSRHGPLRCERSWELRTTRDSTSSGGSGRRAILTWMCRRPGM